MTEKTYQDFKEEILDTKRRGGEYWHNIVSCTLRIADKELGKEEANRLIRECGLKKKGWTEQP